ncbi:uncharacterized protein L203_105128 [Cryptococcus depauperatus CBS 7841]|uniref:non-specific serine/threonine protein kinase n=1 Tax=Cryptococcus depauperatus CBS 7841 TaxID=1295531 RepID=A0A1E3HV67_9TREE|nr:HASPIN protein kinase [Cryptococcus depauperatus CBS 7841]
MANVGIKTRKVTTYGKTKTQIISVHSDFSSSASNDSPIVPSTKRPPLKAKPSQNIQNICTTTPLNTKFTKRDEVDITQSYTPSKLEICTSQHGIKSKPVMVNPKAFRQRKVTKKTTKALVARHSPTQVRQPLSVDESPRKTSPSLPTEHSRRRRRLVFDGVVIPSKTEKEKIDVDCLAHDIAQITINDVQELVELPEETSTNIDASIKDLLQICSSQSVHCFSSLIESLPFSTFGVPIDPVKVGEASYSEVFGISSQNDGIKDFVIKIIPIFDGRTGSNISLPDCSMPEDIVREIGVTKRMGDVPNGGFVSFKGAYVVEGEYPRPLLEQWDIYKHTEGSASVRPSAFSPTQKFCLIILTHAGLDLEAFKFSASNGWIQAGGVFWQVASTLASAETWARFEHRDLHEGQILISPNTHCSTKHVENYLSPFYTSLSTTIIDFGLSRLDMPQPTWSLLPEEVFQGKGAQWDIYRAMRDKIEGDWQGFHPITNVMWLHYILRYMLHNKSMRKPKATRTQSHRSTKFKVDDISTEKAYNMLQLVDKVLTRSVGFGVRRAGLRNTNSRDDTGLYAKLESAQAVVEWGQREGWIV